jgi:mono/diheme cytochrome c family protein
MDQPLITRYQSSPGIAISPKTLVDQLPINTGISSNRVLERHSRAIHGWRVVSPGRRLVNGTLRQPSVSEMIPTMPSKSAAGLLLLLVLWLPASAEAQAPVKTVLDGVYSEAQAGRGQAAYTAVCAACHGNALEGVSAPELTGNRFVERWREGTLDGIYNFLRQRMPPGRAAGAKPIPDNDYLEIVTYILKANGYAVGSTDLAPDLLGSVMFVGKNGPQPVPDGALVMSIGCLSQNSNGGWVLERATEPVRTRSESSTPAEMKTSLQKSLGTLTFRLAELDAVPDFVPETHKGHKMEAKGYLVRQPNAERISLSAMQMIDVSCGP